jgi:hypothetical protein
MCTLSAIADIASIATAVIATWAYGTYRRRLYCNRKSVESFLKRHLGEQKKIPQVAAELWITREEIFEAVGRSKHVERGMASGNEEMLERIWLKWKSN